MIRPETWEQDLIRIFPALVAQTMVDISQKPSLTDEQIAKTYTDMFLAWYHLGCFAADTVPSDVLNQFNTASYGRLSGTITGLVSDTVEITWNDEWPAKPDGFPAPLFE